MFGLTSNFFRRRRLSLSFFLFFFPSLSSFLFLSWFPFPLA